MSVKITEVSKTQAQKTDKQIERENRMMIDLFGEEEEQEQQQEQEEMILTEQDRGVSIKMAVIGVGQAGSRIAEQFYKNEYDAGVINTSMQDLKYIDIIDTNKLCLSGTLGGTGKDLDLGREIFAQSKEQIRDFCARIVEGNHMVYLACSGGGGTGSSSVETMVGLLAEFGMPVGVIYILPKSTEDAQSKKNSIESLARLAKMTSNDTISSLVIVDNARIENIYGGLSQAQFWDAANKAIVDPLIMFNSLTYQPSKYTSLDPSDFGKIISCGDCSVYGMVEVENYEDETGLAQAAVTALSSSMLAEGFDLSQTRTGGVIIVGNEKVLSSIPSINIDYCFHTISGITGGASIYQGVYSVDDDFDGIRIYSWFAGLGLPQSRIEILKREGKEATQAALNKNTSRVSNMNIDMDMDNVKNLKDEIHRKMEAKKTGFGKLLPGSSIIDKRKQK
jgi:tubulin-like protein CetZ